MLPPVMTTGTLVHTGMYQVQGTGAYRCGNHDTGTNIHVASSSRWHRLRGGHEHYIISEMRNKMVS